MNPVLNWVESHPAAAVGGVVLLLAALLLPMLRNRRPRNRRTPAAVVVAAAGALVCTAYSGDTSWGFARDRLGMTAVEERSVMFLAAELALFACALMARQNLRTLGTPGTPGALVWLITGVQVIPAYAESGLVGGTVRAIVGPVMAALLWHLAMGIELRHGSGDGSNSLPALIGRELRERLLSRLGLAVRDRSAEQITRDRATARAVQLAARPHLRRWGRARLAAAVARSGVGIDDGQREVMMQQLAARRGAMTLQTVTLPSPFEPAPAAIEAAPQDPPALPPAKPRLVIPEAAAVSPWADKFPALTATEPTDLTTNAVPAEQGRQVVTEPIILTPSDLRREGRRLNREAVRSTSRPVTIKTLQDELGLSRREATDLRREVVGGERS
ncbi:hypothetical protein [Streptomyces canus]|uniref:hypothetical protein n=1 Tax=Streptomyces canus TaxID=58343 RepID=UPI00039FB409|nr:hypothetical protein [Streptomyces canus]